MNTKDKSIAFDNLKKEGDTRTLNMLIEYIRFLREECHERAENETKEFQDKAISEAKAYKELINIIKRMIMEEKNT